MKKVDKKKSFWKRFKHWLDWSGLRNTYCVMDDARKHYDMDESERKLIDYCVDHFVIHQCVFPVGNEKTLSGDPKQIMIGFSIRDIGRILKMRRRNVK